MSIRRTSFVAAAVAAVLCGCAPVIHIVKPETANPYDPEPQVVVSFTSNFNPSNPWYVDMDGVNITGLAPTPAPGVTSTAPLAFPSFSSHTIHAQGTCGTFCAYPTEAVTFTPPVIYFNGTNANGSGHLNQTVVTTEFVGVTNYSSVPITISIVETTSPKHVRLATVGGALQPPGTGISVTIPPGDNKVSFEIRGDVVGSYILRFAAPGTPGGAVSGTVS